MLGLLTTVASAAETPLAAELATPDADGETLWYSVSHLGVEGQGWTDTKAPFDRLPARAEGVVRPPVWGLSRHSAGLCVRFATDADTLRARWTLTSSRLDMPHMPATGVSGLDLYARTEEGNWRWLAVGRPTESPTNEVTLVSGLPPTRREYLLYFPLYNGVTSVEIGIPKTSTLAPSLRDAKQKPLVFYGTSITQGGCASRPGMVHTAVLSRRLDRPVINLGFSGNGRMDPEVVELLTELDPAVYIIDCLPNMEANAVAERTEPLVMRLRQARPETPILLVEDRTYEDAFLLESKRQRNKTSRAALQAAYQRLVDDQVQQLYYLEGDSLLGDDGEATVDSSHPTDLGFMRMADAFERALRPILAEAAGQ
jgi:hypothetical protein